MQKSTTSLALISLLIIMLSQALMRLNPASLRQISDLEAALALGLIFSAAGVLCRWLVRPMPRPKEEKDPLPVKKPGEKNQLL